MIKLTNVYQNGKIAPGAIEFLYELLAERPRHANISHSTMPTLEQHRAFVVRRVYRAWFLIENDDGERVGAVTLTHANEIGVAVKVGFQHRGYASAAIRDLMGMFKPLDDIRSVRRGRFIANVAPMNEVSHMLFEKLGAKPIQVTYELPALDAAQEKAA